MHSHVDRRRLKRRRPHRFGSVAICALALGPDATHRSDQVTPCGNGGVGFGVAAQVTLGCGPPSAQVQLPNWVAWGSGVLPLSARLGVHVRARIACVSRPSLSESLESWRGAVWGVCGFGLHLPTSVEQRSALQSKLPALVPPCPSALFVRTSSNSSNYSEGGFEDPRHRNSGGQQTLVERFLERSRVPMTPHRSNAPFLTDRTILGTRSH